MSQPDKLDDEIRLLHEKDAARLLNASPRTLQAWRVKGVGPTFIRIGRTIRYQASDLKAWIEARIVPSKEVPPSTWPEAKP